MISKYLLLLGIGHVIGDFYFQTDTLEAKKESCFLAVIKHSILYLSALLLVMIPVFSVDMIIGTAVLSVLHFFIESINHMVLREGKVKPSAELYLYSQCVHIMCILLVAYIMFKSQFKISDFRMITEIFQDFGIQKVKVARWILTLLIIHTPSNRLIQKVLSEIKHVNNATTEKNKSNPTDEYDAKAGRKIGSIERLIMLLFIALEQYTAMGVVLTAKSIARFDRIAKEESFAEYYLLGTLLSTACVVLCEVIII